MNDDLESAVLCIVSEHQPLMHLVEREFVGDSLLRRRGVQWESLHSILDFLTNLRTALRAIPTLVIVRTIQNQDGRK